MLFPGYPIRLAEGILGYDGTMAGRECPGFWGFILAITTERFLVSTIELGRALRAGNGIYFTNFLNQSCPVLS
jgi:hypothetical protein